MKLHLPKELRTALYTCLAGWAAIAPTLGTGAAFAALLAGQAAAEDSLSSLPTVNQWKNYVLPAGTYNLTGATSEQSLLYSYAEGVDAILGLYVESTITVNKVDSMKENSVTTFAYTKLGEGVLIINSQATYAPESVTVEAGELHIQYGGTSAFAQESVTVYNGAKLVLGAENALGNSAATSLTTITLGGGTSTEDAILEVNAATGIYNTLKIASTASIGGTGDLTFNSSSSITGTGTLTYSGSGTLTLSAASQLGSDVALVINSGTVKLAAAYGNADAFSGKDITINAGGRLELQSAYRNASYASIKAGTKDEDGNWLAAGGTLSISTTSAGWGSSNNITLSDDFYGILEITHGGLAVTSGMKLGSAYQINLASAGDGDGSQTTTNGAFLVFGDTRELETTVHIAEGKYGAVNVYGNNTGTLAKLTGSGTLVLREFVDGNATTDFAGELKVSDISGFTGSIDIQRGTLKLTGTSGYALGSAASLTLASNATLTTAGNLTLAGTSSSTTQHSLLGGVTLNEGAGTLYIKNAEVTFGGGNNATNTLSLANITVQEGGKFSIFHDGSETTYAAVGVTLEGGTFHVNDMAGGASGTVLQFGALQVNSASTIDYDNSGNIAFSTLSGTGNLSILKGSTTGTGKTTIGSLTNYSGALSTVDSSNADADNAYKVYINSASQGYLDEADTSKGAYAATLTGKTYSSSLFTKSGDGSVTLDDHTAEAGFAVNAGSVTVSNALTVTGTTTVTAGTLTVVSGASFTAEELLMSGGSATVDASMNLGKLTLNGGTLTLGAAITAQNGFMLTQTDGTLSLTEDVVRSFDIVDNVAGTSNGWGINKYALVVPASGASFSIDEDVSVSVGGNAQTLGTDGTLSLAATSGTYYLVTSAEAYYGTGSGINTAEKIVLVNAGLNYNATGGENPVDIEVRGNHVISLNGTDVVLEASRVSFADGAVARLHGTGSYVMSGAPSSANLSFSDTNGTANEWKGTVVMEDATLSGTQLDDFISKDSNGAATSTVELKNATGSLAAGTHVANVTISGVNITESKGAVVLAGKVGGSGDMEISAQNANYRFSGDVSGWTGTLSNTAEAGVSKVGFTASEAAGNEVNVALNGKLEVTFSGAGETMKVTSALSDYIGTTTISGVVVVLTDPAALGQSDVQVAAHSALNLSELVTQELAASSLAFDSSAILVLGSGALSFTADDAVLSFNESIPTVEGIALLAGADSFTTIDISSWSMADAAQEELILFEQVDSLANASNTTVNLVYGDRSALYEVSLNEQGQVVATAKGAALIPEPTTATLSLLALTALAARRRRRQ